MRFDEIDKNKLIAIAKKYINYCERSPYNDVLPVNKFVEILEDIILAPGYELYPADYIDRHYPFMPQDCAFEDAVIAARKLAYGKKLHENIGLNEEITTAESYYNQIKNLTNAETEKVLKDIKNRAGKYIAKKYTLMPNIFYKKIYNWIVGTLNNAYYCERHIGFSVGSVPDNILDKIKGYDGHAIYDKPHERIVITRLPSMISIVDFDSYNKQKLLRVWKVLADFATESYIEQEYDPCYAVDDVILDLFDKLLENEPELIFAAGLKLNNNYTNFLNKILN